MVYEEHIENLREVIEGLIEADDLSGALALFSNRHPADQADLLEEFEEQAQSRLLFALPGSQLAELLEYLDEDRRGELLAQIPANALAPVLDRLDSDLAVDIVQDLEPEQAEAVVPLLEEREEVQELLAYPEDTAGGRMSTDFVALQKDWTVQEAIDFLRRQQPDTDHPFYLYVVDAAGALLGVVNLRSLVTSPPQTPVSSIVSSVISVLATDDQEVVAERMRHYNLLVLPVVDENDRLLGVITADDVLDVQVAEATEDMYHMAGLPDEERLFRPIRESVPPRLAWLMLNLCTALIAASTVNLFEGTIERVAALAVFMPVVAGMGGNAGIQTITLVVRSIALGEVDPRDASRVLRHEAVIALIKGVVIGLVVAAVAWVWKDSIWLGAVVALALIANIANATLVGVLVPLGLKRLNADPALASGVIVTTFSDVVGFLVFLGLASALISRLT